MSECWTVSHDATPSETRAFGSLDATFALEGDFITEDPLSRVLRVTVDDTRYYVKRYAQPAKTPCATGSAARGFARNGRTC